MRWQLVTCFAALAILEGCARPPNPVSVAAAQYAKEKATCPSSPRVANARCLQALEQRILRPVFSRPDLLDLVGATRLSLAVRVDAGQLRAEDADLEMAKLQTQMVSELERTSLARRSVAAQEAASGPVICNAVGTAVVCN